MVTIIYEGYTDVEIPLSMIEDLCFDTEIGIVTFDTLVSRTDAQDYVLDTGSPDIHLRAKWVEYFQVLYIYIEKNDSDIRIILDPSSLSVYGRHQRFNIKSARKI